MADIPTQSPFRVQVEAMIRRAEAAGERTRREAERRGTKQSSVARLRSQSAQMDRIVERLKAAQ